MTKAELNCLFFPDLLSWERSSVAPIIDELSKTHTINQIEVERSHRGLLKKAATDTSYWILSADWKDSLRFLGVKGKRPNLRASVFGLPAQNGSLATLMWRRLRPELPFIQLVTHSPINFRFYRELIGLADRQVEFLPLPFSPQLQQEYSGLRRPKKTPLTVGTFAPFTSESNLNYFVNVAHYIRRNRPDTRFRILGSGMLYPHLARMIQQMNLEDCVTVVESVTHEHVADLDVLLYVPLRNDHFIPLLVGAAAGIPVLCSEITGIEEFIQDGKNGFIVPCNETKPMGELAIRLLDHEFLRLSIARELKSYLGSKFSVESLAPNYESLLFGKSSPQAQLVRAA